MDLADTLIISNRDWDPSYLSELFSEDYHDFPELWSSNMSDSQLIQEVEKVEK